MSEEKVMPIGAIIAVEKRVEGKLNTLLTEARAAFINGKHYIGYNEYFKPLSEDAGGERDPRLSRDTFHPINDTIPGKLNYLKDSINDAIDMTCTKEFTNTKAFAPLIIGGQTFNLCAGELMALEKKLKSLLDLILVIPTCDPNKMWLNSENNPKARFVTEKEKAEVNSTVKEEVVLQLSPATDKFPAQVKTVMKDVVIGIKSTIYFSGELNPLEKSEMLKRVDSMINDVKKSLQIANGTPIEKRNIGSAITDFIFKI